MPLIIPSNSISGEFEVANSLRFDDGSSDYLQWNSSPSGNRQKFTFSVWLKRSSLGTSMIASSSYSSSDEGYFFFDSNDKLTWQTSSTGMGDLKTNRVFRDTSAWMHIVLSVDTTQSTSTSRMRLYINGSEYTWDGNTTQPDQNKQIYWNVGGTYYPYIGRRADGNYFDGYMSEIVHIDDQQLDATSFGEFDEDSGIWKPIDVSGLTFGGNTSYYLDFENSGSLGADVSGNGNNFTVNNLTSIDQTTDTCTNNFATLNPLAQTTTKGIVSQGNLEYDRQGSTASWVAIGSTIGVTTGKWYYEYKVIDAGTPSQGSQIGFVNYDVSNFQSDSSSDLFSTGEYSFYSGGGNIVTNGSNQGTFEGGYADGDIIMVAIDLDNSYAYWGKNGSWINSGDPTSGSSGTGGFSITGVGTNIFAPAIAHREDGNGQANFGNPPYSISSGNADGNGYGNFEYSVPSGYYSLCTKNLAEYG